MRRVLHHKALHYRLRLKIFYKSLVVLSLQSIFFICLTQSSSAEVFTLGYLTGSQRSPGNLDYQRPGLTISGAISLAVHELNRDVLKKLNHSLKFIVAETYGKEINSIHQTALLWNQQVVAYIGPQETCITEGRLAAAFNLPMISYYCTNRETSNKEDFPTFARTRPPDTQISKSVLSLLLAFNWTQITFLHQADNLYQPVADTILIILRQAGIIIRNVKTWSNIYHHGYTQINPFDDLIENTYINTRIYVILGNGYEHVGLMVSMQRKGLLDKGEYFTVGVDINQYDPSIKDKYLRGLLMDERDKLAESAFQSYLGIFPTAPKLFPQFAMEVNNYMERPPFNYPNPLGKHGGKKISSEAAYLYDAVHLYAKGLLKVLKIGGQPRNGTAIIEAIKGTKYKSAMGYYVYIDENGDAAGNYTVLSRSLVKNEKNQTVPALMPLGTFSQSYNDKLPDLNLYGKINWVGSKCPLAEPICGFRGEKCISYTSEISAGISGGVLFILSLILVVLYRNWRYEQELDSLLWKIDFRDVQMHENEKDFSAQQQKQTRSTHPLIRTSQVSLSSNPDADFRYTTIFTPIGIYKGQLYAIKKIHKKCVDITRDMKKELKLLRDTRHDNICAFIGACTEAPNICVITEYCTRGSLKDILENEDVKLDNMFIASMVADIIRGVLYLHESPIRYHGSLCTSNCLIDSRWVVKLSDFGMFAFKQGIEDNNNSDDIKKINAKCIKLLYRSPELLRLGPASVVPGSQKGDSYSFGIILYEMHTRHGPFGETGLTPVKCLQKVLQPEDVLYPYRPSLQPLETAFDCVREILTECWAERPENRPDFKAIRIKLRPLRKGMKPNIFDNMMAMMEKYANNLEALVDERTDQLQEEKKKTEALLLEMLPRPVAEQLKKGHKVDPESYEQVTIYFSDIVGFTSMSAESTPLQIVDFLNDLYTCFDSIIGYYDVYKVETIGDAYMVVSGLPIRNGDLHAAEIATMSLHLLNAITEFKIRHRTDTKLLLRIGIHTGPVCAGVVGLKMPRYCLFGDTVNTASRMESNGVPLRIHCSSPCKELLDKLGGYHFAERGMIAIKGKGSQRTFWLLGEDIEARDKRSHERIERRGSSNKYHIANKYPWMLCANKSALEKSCHNLKQLQNRETQSEQEQCPLFPIKANDILTRSLLKQKSGQKHKFQNGQQQKQRSNLPNNSPLTRSSSLESPKKLRFASGTLLENHRYHSDDGLLEVMADLKISSLRRSSAETTRTKYNYDKYVHITPARQSCEDFTKWRRHNGYPSIKIASQATAYTPLLLPHIEI